MEEVVMRLLEDRLKLYVQVIYDEVEAGQRAFALFRRILNRFEDDFTFHFSARTVASIIHATNNNSNNNSNLGLTLARGFNMILISLVEQGDLPPALRRWLYRVPRTSCDQTGMAVLLNQYQDSFCEASLRRLRFFIEWADRKGLDFLPDLRVGGLEPNLDGEQGLMAGGLASMKGPANLESSKQGLSELFS